MRRLRAPARPLVLAWAPRSRTLVPERRGGWCPAAPGPPLAAASEVGAATGVRRAAGRAGPGARRSPPARGEPGRAARVWVRRGGPRGRERPRWSGRRCGPGLFLACRGAAPAPGAGGGRPALAGAGGLGLVTASREHSSLPAHGRS